MASTSPWADRFADHRGHARLPEHRVGPAGDARLATEDGRELAAHRVGDREPGLGPEAARLEVAAPAAGRVAGAEGEEEVGGVAVGLGREDRIGRRRWRRARRRRRARRARGPPCRASVSNPGAAATNTRRPARRWGPRRSASRSRTLATDPSARVPDAVEHGDRRRAADAVGGQADVALELDQRAASCRRRGCRPRGRRRSRGRSAGAAARRRRRRGASDGAGRAGGRRGEAALDERGPGLRAADAVDPEPAALLEGAHDRARSRHRTIRPRRRGIS